jgi:hypothetical protein
MCRHSGQNIYFTTASESPFYDATANLTRQLVSVNPAATPATAGDDAFYSEIPP